ncbi:methylmalonyl-CoA mutase family protein [Myxococcota bacterium]|nr:methylmalonyl-CoA mutase family protein [Myxococcota bacterium]
MSERAPFGPPFDPPGLERWREIVLADLRGGDFTRKLVHRDEAGMLTQPLYTQADRPAWALDLAPGQAPWIRGDRPTGGWMAWQAVVEPDPLAAGQAAAEERAGGAHGLHLELDLSGGGSRGVRVDLARDLEPVLRGVPLAGAWVSLAPGEHYLAVAAALLLTLRRLGAREAEVPALLGADPVAILATTGRLPGGSRALAWVGDLAGWCRSQAPGMRAAVADSAPWHEAGAGDADQLALTVASGLTLVRGIEGQGLSMEDAFAQVAFRLRLSTEVFQGVAMIRALRGLWARVAQGCGLAGHPAGAAFVQAMGGRRSWTVRDPWVNLLRGTAITFAGAVGGADAVTCPPMDEVVGLPEPSARRLARNTQLVLADEARLGRVADPGGGSFFLERRTAELMEAAWDRLQALERAGGIIPALCDGGVDAIIAPVRAERLRRVATRQRALTGVSEFPLLDEVRPAPRLAQPSPAPTERPEDTDLAAFPSPGQGGLFAALLDRLLAHDALVPLSAITEALTVETSLLACAPLPASRLAAPFEVLRDRSDAVLARSGRRPTVLLATLGPLSEHLARSTFTRNLLAAGGLDCREVGEDEDVAAALGAVGSGVVVLCGSDAGYARGAVARALALAAQGARSLWLAGRPGALPSELQAELREVGVHAHLAAGADVVESLEQLWAEVEP